jgi:hypothetical protein
MWPRRGRDLTAVRGRSGATQHTPLLVLVGPRTVAILLKGVWAGIFLEHDGARPAAACWIDVHASGGEIAIGLAVLATVVGFMQLRARCDLRLGALVLAVLLARIAASTRLQTQPVLRVPEQHDEHRET